MIAAVGRRVGSGAVSTGNRNYEHRMTAVERGSILASEEKGVGSPLEARQKGYLELKDHNLKKVGTR